MLLDFLYLDYQKF